MSAKERLQPWQRDQLDRRVTCDCGHRYSDHATLGRHCLAMVNDPDRTALIGCTCHRWEPTVQRFRLRP